MPKFYEKRRQKYYAVLDVPKALREQLGVSRRFVKSLQTDSESIARIRVLPVIAKWKQEIVLAKASGNSGNQLLDSVVRVRQDAQMSYLAFLCWREHQFEGPGGGGKRGASGSGAGLHRIATSCGL